MGLWKLIKPQAIENRVKNPSIEEDTTYYSALGAGSSISRVTSDSKFGAAALQVSTADVAGAGVSVQNSDKVAAYAYNDYTWSLYAKITSGTSYDFSLTIEWYDSGGSSLGTDSETFTMTDEWVRYQITATAPATSATALLSVLRNETGTHTYLIDALQFEEPGTATTYCDGDQPGCEWSGEEHNSTSTRDADAWQGGREYDLADDYSFIVETVTGMDSPPVEVFGTPYAVLPGEAADGERILARDMFIIGEIYSNTSFADFQDKKATFYDEIKHWRAGQNSRNSDPIKLRYAGTNRSVEIECKYVGGFEGTHSHREGAWRQKFTLQFRAQEDVWFHSINQLAAVLDEEDSGTARYAMAKVDGTWTLMGPPAAGSSGSVIWAMVHDGINLYAGGDIVAFNNDGDLDYLWKWNGSAWATLDDGSDGTGTVYDLALLPDGKIVGVGDFDNWDGIAAADDAFTYDPSSDAYAAIGSGPGSAATDVAVDPTSGDIAVVCNAGSEVQLWDGSSWSDITPSDFYSIDCVFYGNDGTLYAGGDEDNGYPTTPYQPLLQAYDGSSWSDEVTGNGITGNEYINTGAELSDGRIVVGGEITDLEGVTVANVAIWNGQTVDDMDGGITLGASGYIARIFVDDNDFIYATGNYTAAGGRDADELAFYNGYTWMPLDIDPAGFPYAIAFDGDDMYIGFDGSATAYYSGDTTISTTGGRPINPRFKIKRSGGTTATIRYIQNVDTDSELWFDIDMLDGETITIDIGNRTIISDFGRRIRGQPLPGSAGLGSFEMDESSNQINLWVDTSGSPTITATMDYWVNYDGWAGGDVD